MHALIVVAHHDPRSLTHAVAAQVGEGLVERGGTFELADLSAQGFDPRYTLADHAVHRHQATPPADVLAEQARLERADTLVLAFPIYWWSMPALLKGWIDRVFSNGWAFGYDPANPEGGMLKKLGHLKVHLIGLGGADAGTFDRRGYAQAMQIQIDHGIFDYCGAKVESSVLMLESETVDPAGYLANARRLGQALA